MNRDGISRDISRLVGANIRLARGDLTQRELGEKLGISVQQVSDWERGAYRPNDRSLLRLCDALDREFVWFFTEHREPDREPDRTAA